MLNVGKHQQQQHGNPELARSIISGILNFTPLLLASIKSSYRTTDSLPRIFKKSEENKFFCASYVPPWHQRVVGVLLFRFSGGFLHSLYYQTSFLVQVCWSVATRSEIQNVVFFTTVCLLPVFPFASFLSLFLSLSIHGGTNYTTNVSVFPRFRMGRLYFVTTGCIFFNRLR